MIWFTSDLHFGHKNIIKYCDRPYASLEAMKRDLIKNWNAKVKFDDVVYVLGDVFFCGTKEAESIMNQLNGIKILIRGNHDYDPTKCAKVGFHSVMEKSEMYLAKGVKVKMCHFPYRPKIDDIPSQLMGKINNAKQIARETGKDKSSVLDDIVNEAREKGQITEEQQKRLIGYDLRYWGRRWEDDGGWLLCGHVHEKWAEYDKMINVGVDVRGFAPMSKDEILSIIQRKEQENG